MSSVSTFNSGMESALWDLSLGTRLPAGIMWSHQSQQVVYSKVPYILMFNSTYKAANSAADFFSEFCWCGGKLVFLPHIVGSASLLHFSTICLYEWDDWCDGLGITRHLGSHVLSMLSQTEHLVVPLQQPVPQPRSIKVQIFPEHANSSLLSAWLLLAYRQTQSYLWLVLCHITLLQNLCALK